METKELKTVTGRIIKVTPNEGESTYTLRTESGIYKTIPFNRDEFEGALKWTGNDWQQFLRTNEYYKL